MRKPNIPPIDPSQIGPKKTPHAKFRARVGGIVPPPKRRSVVKNVGTCYQSLDCRGKILFKNISKTECKRSGGKSWKGPAGCQNFRRPRQM